jgi:hypothetical protein
MQNLSVYTLKPLGEQLRESGLLTEEQLRQALALQKQHPEKLLGQILIDAGFLSREEFEQFMRARISIQQPLGELLIQKGLITREQLGQALSVQMQTAPAGRPLGQVLVEQGAIAQAVLDEIVQQQAREREAVRSQVGQQQDRRFELGRGQIEDIQKLMGAGHLCLSLARALMPDARTLFEERFHVFLQIYQPPEQVISEALQRCVSSFFTHFLPLLEWGMDESGEEAEEEERYQIMNKSFFNFMDALARLMQIEIPLVPSLALSSLIQTDARDLISFREALYLVMRSPSLMPHGSLLTLRFLLNEFWGQRSILEQRGVQLVRSEDDIDMSDFFRPRFSQRDSDLEYANYLENHNFTQIDLISNRLRTCQPFQRESTLAELMNFYLVLFQTRRDLKTSSQSVRED